MRKLVTAMMTSCPPSNAYLVPGDASHAAIGATRMRSAAKSRTMAAAASYRRLYASAPTTENTTMLVNTETATNTERLSASLSKNSGQYASARSRPTGQNVARAAREQPGPRTLLPTSPPG